MDRLSEEGYCGTRTFQAVTLAAKEEHRTGLTAATWQFDREGQATVARTGPGASAGGAHEVLRRQASCDMCWSGKPGCSWVCPSDGSAAVDLAVDLAVELCV